MLPTDRKPTFRQDEDGAVAVIVALLLTVLLGFAALGVDMTSLYRERAKLQSIADLTVQGAMAQPDIATSRAHQVMTRNDTATSALQTLQTGRFLRNPAIPAGDRFTPLPAGSTGVNAVRLILEEDAPLYFATIFTDDTHVTLHRTALATRTGAASFALNSYLLNISDASLNDLLIDAFGINASLSVGDMQALDNANLNSGDLLDALNIPIGANPADVLNATTTAADLIDALQAILPAPTASRLNGLETAAGSASFDISSLIGGIDTALGLTATDFASQINLTALDVVKAIVAAQSDGTGVGLSAPVTVAGVLSTSTGLTAAEPPADSGLIALGEDGTQLHRAAVRVKSDIEIDPTLLGNLGVGVQVTSVNLPVYVELAGATATLNQIGCNVSAPNDIAARFLTGPTALHPLNGTSVAALYLGELPDTSGPINPDDLGSADLLNVTLTIDTGLPLVPDIEITGITIQARSHVAVGTSVTETLTFTQADVAAGNTTKTFGSGNLLSSATRDLLSPSNTELRVKPGQDGLISGLAAPIVATLLNVLPDRLLTSLATPIDGVLDSTRAGLGLEVGAGELTVTGQHCEPIRLVR